MNESGFFFNSEIPLTDLGGGVSRRIVANNSAMMMVEVHFAENSVGTEHTHVHTQCTYVLCGEFRFKIGDETKIVKAGDSLAFASGQRHGTLCLKEGVLIDVFTPPREDFLQ